MKIAFLFLTVAVSLAYAQTAGGITGTVTDAVSHIPLHRALVSAANGSRDVTDMDSRFSWNLKTAVDGP